MHPKDQVALEKRVRQAAEVALADHYYVSAIDVLREMGLLAPRHADDWRKGRIESLEQAIQGSPQKISYSLKSFREWAESKALKPSETRYVRSTRGGTSDLRFSVSGDPDIEKFYRTHYVSPALSGRMREKLQKRLDRKPQPVVFQIVRDSECSECGVELHRTRCSTWKPSNRCVSLVPGWMSLNTSVPATPR